MKIYFSADGKSREGFTTYDPCVANLQESGTVEEITGEGILEKIPDLVSFIQHCYRMLKSEGTCTFTAHYYTSWQAWQDPRNIRGISQASLNFADKNWREQNGCPDLADCDFAVGCNFAIDQVANQRSEAAKEFWLNRYNNIVQSVQFVLTKRAL